MKAVRLLYVLGSKETHPAQKRHIFSFIYRFHSRSSEEGIKHIELKFNINV